MRWEIARALPPPRTVLCDRHRESHRGRRTCAAPALTIRGQAEGRAVVLARVIAAPHGVAPRLERVACYVDELRNTAVHAIPDDRAEQRSDGRQAIHCRRASRGSEGPLGGQPSGALRPTSAGAPRPAAARLSPGGPSASRRAQRTAPSDRSKKGVSARRPDRVPRMSRITRGAACNEDAERDPYEGGITRCAGWPNPSTPHCSRRGSRRHGRPGTARHHP